MLSGKSLSKEQLPQTALPGESFRASRKERHTSCSWHLSRRLMSRNASTMQSTSWGSAGVSGTRFGSAEPLMRGYTYPMALTREARSALTIEHWTIQFLSTRCAGGTAGPQLQQAPTTLSTVASQSCTRLAVREVRFSKPFQQNHEWRAAPYSSACDGFFRPASRIAVARFPKAHR